MRLSDARDPLALWQYAERFLGVGTRTYSPYAGDLDIDDAFHPQLGAASFTVPTFRVPPELGTWRTSRAPAQLGALYRDGDGFFLPVHPNALDSADLVGRDLLARCGPGPVLEVVPSANARTVFVTAIDGVGAPAHFVKLHYPRRLSRFTRRLRRPVIELQLWVVDELIRVGVPVLPEVAGGFLADLDAAGAADPDTDESWGFLIRAAEPVGAEALPCTVPLFALYGRDLHAPADPTLLEQLVRVSGEPPVSFIAERIVAPVVRLWVRAAVHAGVSLEPHGQNTLFSFTADARDTKVLYRDCAVYVDETSRSARGLDTAAPINVLGRDVHQDRRAVFSLGYDSFLGHHALDYLARLAEDVFGVPPTVLRAAARAAFEAPDLLPNTVFYYENALFDNSAWKLVDTGEPPHWR